MSENTDRVIDVDGNPLGVIESALWRNYIGQPPEARAVFLGHLLPVEMEALARLALRVTGSPLGFLVDNPDLARGVLDP